MTPNLTSKRIELLRRLLQPVADAESSDRSTAQGLLFSIGAAERKEAAR